MEISRKNRFGEFLKNYWMYVCVGITMLVIAIVFGVIAGSQNAIPTGNTNMEFSLPMDNATIVKDYSSTELQENPSLNQWEAHLSVDFVSDNKDVFAVLDGNVTSVGYDILNGYSIEITHSNGFVSKYCSLGENVEVKEGDKVVAGQKIGQASKTATGEIDLGEHLHFTLYLNEQPVDPNNYLDLQNK